MIRNSFPPLLFKITMSSEETMSFLDGLFSVNPESQDTYSIDEKSLLAEIFGRFEDDFDFELDDEVQVSYIVTIFATITKKLI